MQGDVSMKFHDETFAKGFIHNGILVGLVRYFTTEGHLINITDISMTTSINIFLFIVYFRVKDNQLFIFDALEVPQKGGNFKILILLHF